LILVAAKRVSLRLAPPPNPRACPNRPLQLLITYEGRHNHLPPNVMGRTAPRRTTTISPAARAARRDAAAAALHHLAGGGPDAEEAAVAMHFLSSAAAEPAAIDHFGGDASGAPPGPQPLGAGLHRVAPGPAAGELELSALETLAAAAAEHEGWIEPGAKVREEHKG
jgi:hypothetical protein